MSLIDPLEDANPVERLAVLRLFGGLSRMVAARVRPTSQLLQDAFALGGGSSPGFFVEVGAGHPFYLSNVARLIDPFEWEGVRIDPNPEFARLHHAENGRKVCFEGVAIGEEDGSSLELVVMGELSTRLELAEADAHRRSRRRAVRRGQVRTVPVRRLDCLLTEIGWRHDINYLSVDTEGSELEVLRTVPFETLRVDAITVEHNYRAGVITELDELLALRGFARVLRHVSAWDAWYLNESLLEDGVEYPSGND